MNITEMYFSAIENEPQWLTISEWAIKVGELYPDLLAKADEEAKHQANDTTGLREIAARISSAISRGAYLGRIDIDARERPKRIRCATLEEIQAHEQEELEDDIAPLRRGDILKSDFEKLSVTEKYRISEFETISQQLKQYFGLGFEVDHAAALLNKEKPGHHHPDNLQLLLKAHNAKKNNSNWPRLTLEEQIAYIKMAVDHQAVIASRLGVEMDVTIIEALIERLKNIY